MLILTSVCPSIILMYMYSSFYNNFWQCCGRLDISLGNTSIWLVHLTVNFLVHVVNHTHIYFEFAYCYLQSNEVKNSYAMELEGLKRCLAYLAENHVNMTDLVTDRHSQVKKYMRENTEIRHWFDVWHVAKGTHNDTRIPLYFFHETSHVHETWQDGVSHTIMSYCYWFLFMCWSCVWSTTLVSITVNYMFMKLHTCIHKYVSHARMTTCHANFWVIWVIFSS